MTDQAKPKDEKADKKQTRRHDEDPVGTVYDSALMRRLALYMRPYWVQAAISSVSVTLKAMSDVAGPYFVNVAIDRYMTHENRGYTA